MGKPSVLIINSYAGSIVQGVTQAKHEIVASMEDSAFGINIQKANFPKLTYHDTRDQWPKKLDLSDSIVMAHPPCSAFSLMTPRWQKSADGKTKVGLDSDAFACTINVLNYAMGNKALAIAVESVPGALEGARSVHDKFAARGYDLFRIQQNAVTFGNPQWRQRFWALFVRKGVLPNRELHVVHRPQLATVGSILMKKGGTPIERDVEAFERQRAKLKAQFGKKFADAAMLGEQGYGTMLAIINKELKRTGKLDSIGGGVSKTGIKLEKGTPAAVVRALCERAPYVTNVLRIMDPEGMAPTVLAGAWWSIGGTDRPLVREEYNRIMGFPDDYAWPGSTHGQFRMYLSKGVVPAVARWVCETLSSNVTGQVRKATHKVSHGDVLNLCPTSRSMLVDVGAAA
jgi:site-specific DNA-cytosine methylase